MKTVKVEVTHYVACDGREFDDYDMCLAYESERRMRLIDDVRHNRESVRTLKEFANQCRLQFLLAQVEAQDAAFVGDRPTYHKKMYDYYANKKAYNGYISSLSSARNTLNRLLDQSYIQFGDRNRSSSAAKKERREKSKRWRETNTPDKWRTPNKIRVSKQPAKEGGK